MSDRRIRIGDAGDVPDNLTLEDAHTQLRQKVGQVLSNGLLIWMQVLCTANVATGPTLASVAMAMAVQVRAALHAHVHTLPAQFTTTYYYCFARYANH